MNLTKNDWLGKAILALFKKKGAQALKDPRLLRLAVKFNRLDLVLFLLDKGANAQSVDRRGRTPLFFAANRRMVRTLVEAGARVNHRSLAGHKPLHEAVRAGRMDVSKALLHLGADLHAQDARGMTPLHAAASRGRTEACEHLIKQGAWPNVRDRKGRSPLFFAVAGGHLSTALMLIDKGADLLMVDHGGTPWIQLARLDQVFALQSAADRVLEEEQNRDYDWGPADSSQAEPELDAACEQWDWRAFFDDDSPAQCAQVPRIQRTLPTVARATRQSTRGY